MDVEARTEIGRELIVRGITDLDRDLAPPPAMRGPAGRRLNIPFPDGLAPSPAPMPAVPDPTAALPPADVVVITWTVDEQDALCDVFTPGFSRAAWYRYARDFPEYAPKIRPGAPAAI